MKRALITGVTGQDGSYLAEFLLGKGYKIFGMTRRSSTLNYQRLKDVVDEIEIVHADLLDQTSLMKVIEYSKPDEIYNLAAQSFVPTSWEQPVLTGEFTALGVTRVLEAVRTIKSDCKFYQASSSEMFGKVREVPQNENTPFYPRSPYGVAKVYGHWITVNYRESYNLFACSGILFNHESPRRGYEFVTRKISRGVARIKKGYLECLKLGNLDAKRDWGFAGDYVEAMWLMLQQDKPDDYVIATGVMHSVRDFCKKAFEVAGYDIIWEGKGLEEVGRDSKSGKILVKVNKKYYRPAEVNLLVGDSSKAKSVLKWKQKISFDKLVEMMVEYDLNIIE